ncbi:MAG: alpha/beta fold hydrolase BchO [Pseudomonadota bacterium]
MVASPQTTDRLGGSQRSAAVPADWPLASHSDFVRASGLTWHVQSIGDGPKIVMLHGAGSSTHTWHGMLDVLTSGYQVVMVDLPGHGLSEPFSVGAYTLPRTAQALRACLKALGVMPQAIVGHSAGAAIALQLLLEDTDDLERIPIFAINPALLPFSGLAGVVFPVFAKFAAQSGLVRSLLARRARDDRQLQRVIDGTGSVLNNAQLASYQRLMRRPAHVRSVLAMMAGWDLHHLLPKLRRKPQDLMVWVTQGDRAVPADATIDALQAVPSVTIEKLEGLGHLAHEERPEFFAHALLAPAKGTNNHA